MIAMEQNLRDPLARECGHICHEFQEFLDYFSKFHTNFSISFVSKWRALILKAQNCFLLFTDHFMNTCQRARAQRSEKWHVDFMMSQGEVKEGGEILQNMLSHMKT